LAVIVQARITEKITTELAPSHLEVINESHMHSVPPGSESHFKLVIVTDAFEGLPLVRRHQQVNGILADELRDDIHALSMDTLTAEEWTRKGGRVEPSPQCLGGSKPEG
jgi:BolA protein